MTVDGSQNIYVVDRGNNRIQVFDPGGGFLYKFGAPGSGPGEFNVPVGIAVDSSNRIIVADRDNHRIQVFAVQAGVPTASTRSLLILLVFLLAAIAGTIVRKRRTAAR